MCANIATHVRAWDEMDWPCVWGAWEAKRRLMMARFLLCQLSFIMKALFFLLLLSLYGVFADVTITSLKRSIDLRGHVEEVNSIVEFKNHGKESVHELIVAIPEGKIKNLAYLEGTHGRGRKRGRDAWMDEPWRGMDALYHLLAGGMHFRTGVSLPLLVMLFL